MNSPKWRIGNPNMMMNQNMMNKNMIYQNMMNQNTLTYPNNMMNNQCQFMNLSPNINNPYEFKFPKEDKKKEEIKEEKNFSYSSSAKISKDNYRNIMSYNFENEVKEFFSGSQDSESLQNLIFYFNLKMFTKSNKLKSVLITFNNKSAGTLYGFKEIDFCLKNKASRDITTNNILSNNLIYIFNNNNNRYFQLKNPQPMDISLKENSIIFGEIKNAFPYTITKGVEKFQIITLKENAQYDDMIKDNNISFTYIDHLDILLKKATIFFEFFFEEKLINKDNLFHIIYIYDESNFSRWENENKEIEDQIKAFFDKTKVPKLFNNAVFQIAYFNKQIYNKKKDEKMKMLEEKGKEDSKKIKMLEEKGKELEEKRKEDSKTIEKLKEQIQLLQQQQQQFGKQDKSNESKNE
jgi:hypothetical protein